jgi:hypothetical protein
MGPRLPGAPLAVPGGQPDAFAPARPLPGDEARRPAGSAGDVLPAAGARAAPRQVFVRGDSRNSQDSCLFGPVPAAWLRDGVVPLWTQR